MAVTVRWPVPRSCVEVWAVTEPSAAMVTVHSFGLRPPAAPGVQRHADAVLDRPRVRLPGGCHFFFQSDISAMAAISVV